MLDRLISGAGAVSHLADRLIHVFVRGGSLAHQPAGLLLAGLLAVAALVLVVVAVDNSGDATPRDLTAGELATGDHGERLYANVVGVLASGYVETYIDDNRDDVRQPEERGQAWNYFLVDPTSRAGVTITSRRPPSAIYTFRATGVVVEDEEYVAQDMDYFRNELAEFGVTLDPTRFIDARETATGLAYDLADDLPAVGTAVVISGSRGVDFVAVCPVDTNGDGVCGDDEADLYDVYVYDPVSKRAVTVLTAISPEFTPASFTGVIRRSPNAVKEAIEVEGGSITDIGVSVSPTYMLTDGDVPSDPLPSYILAGLAAVLAGVIVLGVVGGYLRFRPAGSTPPALATMAPGEGVPVRVTGVLRGPAGLTHVREAMADLKRFVLPTASEDVAAGAAPAEPTEATDTHESAGPTAPAGPPATTVIVERRDLPEGVAVGRGELTGIQIGTVSLLRGTRPALRLTAGTGPILVSFESVEARDRAAAELAAELAPAVGQAAPAAG
ncbi:MAG: hypothetical protein ACXW4L_07100 [Candidatus Limnocylindrales bacterium]